MENSKLKCKIVNIQQACNMQQEGDYEQRLDNLKNLIDELEGKHVSEASARKQAQEENERLSANADEARKQAESVQQQYMESLN